MHNPHGYNDAPEYSNPGASPPRRMAEGYFPGFITASFTSAALSAISAARIMIAVE